MLAWTNYRQVLKQILEIRTQRNPYYSIRALARDLGMSSGRMADILNGKQGLSTKAAHKIAKSLGFSEKETKTFVDLVEKECARSSAKREAANRRIEQQGIQQSALQQEDVFHAIAEWYHSAILEICRLEGFESDHEWIAKKIGITPKMAELAIERLLRLGLLIFTILSD